jgi:hypothetical protein
VADDHHAAQAELLAGPLDVVDELLQRELGPVDGPGGRREAPVVEEDEPEVLAQVL